MADGGIDRAAGNRGRASPVLPGRGPVAAASASRGPFRPGASFPCTEQGHRSPAAASDRVPHCLALPSWCARNPWSNPANRPSSW